jgi:Smg protein
MFDILVYLYETYYRSEACPDSEVLIKKLSAVGFEEEDISRAIGWLSDLSAATSVLAEQDLQSANQCSGFRVYASQEFDALGTEAIGFLQFLESAKLLNPAQREIVIERALATNEYPIALDKLKVIILMVLWSQGTEPDGLMFDELFLDDGTEPRLLH